MHLQFLVNVEVIPTSDLPDDDGPVTQGQVDAQALRDRLRPLFEKFLEIGLPLLLDLLRGAGKVS